MTALNSKVQQNLSHQCSTINNYQIFCAAPLADDGVADRGQVRHVEHAAEPLARLVQHEGLEEGVLVLSRGGQCGRLSLLEGQRAIHDFSKSG